MWGNKYVLFTFEMLVKFYMEISAQRYDFFYSSVVEPFYPYIAPSELYSPEPTYQFYLH